ncbi:MAG: aminomethyl transferase family protein [Rhodospirillales bacterium]|nr:aminomethyl transferase family protein [Rhodospirillales bacterium]
MSNTSNYASAHATVRISAKRFNMSPWMPAYLTDKALLGRRFYALGLGDDPISDYWHLRRQTALYDVPEHPIEISGPDACALLDKVFCRDISKLHEGRAIYAISCNQHGGILMDGVLMKRARTASGMSWPTVSSCPGLRPTRSAWTSGSAIPIPGCCRSRGRAHSICCRTCSMAARQIRSGTSRSTRSQSTAIRSWPRAPAGPARWVSSSIRLRPKPWTAAPCSGTSWPRAKRMA